MKSSISLKRLSMLIKRQYTENRKSYLFAMVATIGLFSVFSLTQFANQPQLFAESAFYAVYLGGLYIVGCLLAANSFAFFEDKRKAANWLSIPASRTEKYICSLLYINVFFFASYSICFFIIKSITIFLYSTLIVQTDPQTFQILLISDQQANFYLKCTLLFFIIQNLYFFGSIFFLRHAFWYTTIVISLFAIIILIYQMAVAKVLFPGYELASGPTLTAAAVENNIPVFHQYGLPNWFHLLFQLITFYLWIPIIWLAGWIRIQTKQLE